MDIECPVAAEKRADKMLEFLRLQRSAAAPTLCLAALENYCLASPAVQQAAYYVWQPEQSDYLPVTNQAPQLLEDYAPDLSAAELRQQLLNAAATSNQAPQSECLEAKGWLLQRFEFAASGEGLLVIQLGQPDQRQWVQGLVASLVATQQASEQLLQQQCDLVKDPQPSLRVLANGDLAEQNVALQGLLTQTQAELVQLLPSNHRALVRSSLLQERAIEEVESSYQDTIVHWTYIPILDQQQVLVRGKDVSQTVKVNREAAQAWRLYRLITENSMDLISRHAPDGCFIDASPASWSLLGYWPEEMRGMQGLSLFHPDDAAQMYSAYNALSQQGYYTMTWRARHREGHYVWFETASRAIRETYTGSVVEIVSISRDITRRVLIEEHRQRLAEVVQANTDLILFLAPDGWVSGANPSAQKALQVAAEQTFAIKQVLAAEDYQRLRTLGWQQAETTGVWSAEVRLQPLQGRTSFPASLVLLAHRGRTGERYYSLVARDMTERERHEVAQRKHQEELAHTARLITLGELTSGIAHEMNQPLAAIMNYANASLRYLQQAAADESLAKVTQGLQRINEHAQHAAEVIKQLRALLRKEPRRLQALSVQQVVHEAVRLCQWQAGSWLISITTELPEQLPAIYADRVLLEQVLLNLIRNAMEANHQALPNSASEIQVRASLTEQQQIMIQVSDQGGGGQQANLEQLFTPFYTEKKDGLGLGLSMSRSIVEGFGGELNVQRLNSGGLMFSCCLPLREKATTASLLTK